MDDYCWTSWRFAGCQVSEVLAMTPPPRTRSGGNTGDVDTFDSTALTRLEGRMDNGEQDIRELRKAIDERRESQDRLEKRIEEKEGERAKLDRDIYERLGSLKTMQGVLIGLMIAILGAIIGLAFVALHK